MHSSSKIERAILIWHKKTTWSIAGKPAKLNAITSAFQTSILKTARLDSNMDIGLKIKLTIG